MLWRIVCLSPSPSLALLAFTQLMYLPSRSNATDGRWAAVYEEEMEVLNGESAARAAGVGRTGLFSSGVGGGAQPKKGNQGPPPKDKPGPGSFNGETFTGDSWDSSGTSF